MLKNKVALITGSTSGIGLAIAESLAKNGCRIAFNGFANDEIKSSIKQKFNDLGVESLYSPADLAKVYEIKRMIDFVHQNFGSIDILVNNAGIQHVDPIDDFPDSKWDDIIAVNLSANFHTIKNTLPIMKKNNWGRIINIASVHGKVASVNKSAYVAAKHALLGLSKVVALETAQSNITCNAICPGWVHTALVQKQIEDIAKKQNLSIELAEINLLSEKQPSLKFVKPDDIAAAVVYLCMDYASEIRGSEIVIDGGWTAR